ncbi:MAG: oxygen-dependent protoporphyrinogen oxidase [Icmadophila ericetorum]|nr:oxygen-dependent protoporphyrinogen oxidase [Icmadophila ericetorum]
MYILLKECYTRRHVQCTNFPLGRGYASDSTADQIKDVAVLGGGITGLATAFYLSEALPSQRISLFEASSRLGGWLQSTSVDVGTGKVVFEQGPRNLRPSNPNGRVTLDLIRQLDLQNEVLTTTKDSPAAQNRFIYYPDHLVRMPGPGGPVVTQIIELFTEPAFRGLVSGIFAEMGQPRRAVDLTDESVGSFLSRRIGSGPVDNLVSAVLHGIYAGDVYQLSARSLLKKYWHYEKLAGTVTAAALTAFLQGKTPVPYHDYTAIQEMNKEMHQLHKSDSPAFARLRQVYGSSVFTFKKGIGQLSDRLVQVLSRKRNVKIYRDAPIRAISIKEDGTPKEYLRLAYKKATTTNPEADPTNLNFTHIISTLPSSSLPTILSPSRLSIFSQTPSVTVLVVNLFYSNPSLLSVRGFGYLLPRSIPFEQNPERALGVVFDSDATIGQDTGPAGTKITVMLGGHWWDGWNSYPDEEEGAAMAKAVLARHLKITSEPQAIRVALQRNCIPQYTVGHHERMGKAHEELKWNYHGRLRVAGNSYTGVGLNDCVRAARDVVRGLIGGKNGDETGLERFVEKEKWVEWDLAERKRDWEELVTEEMEQEQENKKGNKGL